MMKNILTKAGRLFTALPIYLLMMSLGISDAMAGALDNPKADGLIGEQTNGYLGLVRQDVPQNIKALIKQVNAKRKTRYRSIAQNESVPLLEVEQVGGATAIEKTLRGNYVQDRNGRWRKK